MAHFCIFFFFFCIWFTNLSYPLHLPTHWVAWLLRCSKWLSFYSVCTGQGTRDLQIGWIVTNYGYLGLGYRY